MRQKSLISSLVGLVVFLLIGCILGGEKNAGRGSEVENEVYGTLVDASGNPVLGARVKVLPLNATTDTDSVVTDARGRYAFDSLSPGTYSLLGDYNSGALVVYRPEVVVNSGMNFGTDTMRVPGSIRGRFLAGSKGKAGVLTVVAGLSRLELSDDSGHFEIKGVPQGEYTLRYSATGFIILKDTGVVVQSGIETVLPDKYLEYDPSLNPPEPVGLKAAYDTLNERVILTWEAVSVSDLDGFLIYRDDPSFLNPEIVKGGFTKGTEFIDTSFGSLGSAEDRDLVYRIKSRDRGLNQSLNFSEPAQVRVVPRQRVMTIASVQISGLRDGKASPGDSIVLQLTFFNPGRHIRSILWYREGFTEPLRSAVIEVGTTTDTLMRMTGLAGEEAYHVIMTDDAGSAWEVATSYTVIQDVPSAFAGPDVEVSLSDSVLLQGSGTDLLGRVVRWEWSIDGNTFANVPGGAISFLAPDRAGKLHCIFRVTDEDGNQALDTLMLNVLQDAPNVTASQDMKVSLGDTVRIHAAARDGFGRIAAWAWDIGGTGTFRSSLNGDTAFAVPRVPGVLPCIIRVEDDDAQVAYDTLHISIVTDPPVVEAGPDTAVSLSDRIALHAIGKDSFGSIVEWAWDAGGLGIFRPSGSDTSIIAPNRTGKYHVVVRVEDDDGERAFDTVTVDVIADPPAVSVGGDTTLSIGDTLILTATGTDRFGAIVKWEWSVDANPYQDLGRMARIFLPATPADSLPIVCRVTDDDGVTASDTLYVAVIEDRPLAVMAADAMRDAFVGDTVRLTGKASSDRFGRIVAYEWDVGSTGTYTPSQGPDKIIVLPDFEIPTFTVRLRVRDDDGSTGLDSLIFVVHGKTGRTWIDIPSPAPDFPRYNASGFVLNDKMWMVGGYLSLDTWIDTSRVWSSDDGFTWNKVASKLPFKMAGNAEAFNGNMWALEAGAAGSLRTMWRSADGVNWSVAATIPLPTVDGEAILSFAGRLWIISGRGVVGGWDKFFSDVWSSVDGISWVEETGAAPFPGRYSHVAIEAFGKMLIAGGGTSDGNGHWSWLNDIWMSSDGKNWTHSSDMPGQLERSRLAAVTHNGKAWLIGGFKDETYYKDAWISSDGVEWIQVTADGITGEDGASAVSFQGKVWLLGGRSKVGWDSYNYHSIRYSK